YRPGAPIPDFRAKLNIGPLPPGDRERLVKLLGEYMDIFAEDISDLRRIKEIQQNISSRRETDQTTALPQRITRIISFSKKFNSFCKTVLFNVLTARGRLRLPLQGRRMARTDSASTTETECSDQERLVPCSPDWRNFRPLRRKQDIYDTLLTT